MAVSPWGRVQASPLGPGPGFPVTKATHGQTPAQGRRGPRPDPSSAAAPRWEQLKLRAEQASPAASGSGDTDCPRDRVYSKSISKSPLCGLGLQHFQWPRPYFPSWPCPIPPTWPCPISPSWPRPRLRILTLLVCKDPQVTKDELEMASPRVASV